MSSLTIHVTGTPAPQGSKRGYYNKHTGRVQMVESSNKVKPWRQDVKHAALNAIATQTPAWGRIDGPVEVIATFWLTRPRGHFGTGRNAAVLKPSAPAYPAVKPDLDKIVRSSLDALGEAGVWTDDSRVVLLHVMKLYADGDTLPGADITVRALDNTDSVVAGPRSLPPAPATTDPQQQPIPLEPRGGVNRAGTAGTTTVQEALL